MIMQTPNAIDTPAALRQKIRGGRHTGTTAGCCPGFVQANLVILPIEHALEFMTFCIRNPKPCPLLDITDPGSPHPPTWLANDGADVRTDIPMYRVWQNGKLLKEADDVTDYWRDDFVVFFLGCSFSFEEALVKANLSVRHLEEGKNVPMYKTNIPCRPAGPFQGNMVVSMRPYRPEQLGRVSEVTSRMKAVHGGPIHTGDPAAIGIIDLGQPDYGDAVSIASDEVPVFFACGVTPQNVILDCRLPGIAITHAPGAMFVTDVLNDFLTQN